MNPEFQRNLWLEISPARLLLMPAVLALVGLLVAALNGGDTPRSLFLVFSVLFIGLGAGWGSLLVVSSINHEVTERTWDQQRLSALGPWQMAWGKLLGSTAYAWYGALLCAATAVLAALAGPAFWSRCTWLLAGAVGTLALHAWLLASRLHVLDIRTEKTSGMAGRLLGVLLVLQTLPLLFMALRDPSSPERDGPGSWWGLGLPLPVQSLTLAGLLLALGLLALWRSMGRQLMVRSVPWAWVLGVVGLGWSLAGFLPKPGLGPALWATLAATALVATYVALFTEPSNRLVWQTLFYHRAHSSTRRLAQALPLWPLAWALAALCLLAYTLGSTASASPQAPSTPAASLLWMALLHGLRDCGIYQFFALRNTTRKPAAMTLLTLFLLGVVLPGLVASSAPDLARWLEPFFGLKDLLQGQTALGASTWAAMAVHLLAVALLVAWRWRASRPSDTP